jgi:hypothetical protein
LSLPQVEGPRPLWTRIINAYMDRVLAAAETDPAVAQQFLRLIGMLDGPSRLLRPLFMFRVARTIARRTPAGDQMSPQHPGDGVESVATRVTGS